MRAAAFILSDVRSGSTLLDQCLGAHEDVISLGESHWLPAYVTLDRTQYNPVHELVCACGKRVADCEFWRSVRSRLGRPLESLRLHSGFTRPRRSVGPFSRLRFLARRIVRSAPELYRLAPVQVALGGRELGQDISDLFDAACAVSRRSVCVDSSKSPFRFRALYRLHPEKAVAIVLTRDYRAVVHSKMRRGESLESAARGWCAAMRQIDALTRDLPPHRVHHLKYECLCENPRSEMTRLCEFLGLGFSETMLRRQLPGMAHHIGGSPSKFDVSRTAIALDRSHVEAFSEDELRRMRRLVGSDAVRWSY
jgi:hypothetical protein